MRCQECNAKVVEYPIKDKDGKWIIKNFFKMNMIHFWFLLSIALILFGVNQFTEDCFYIKEKPGEFCDQWDEYKEANRQYFQEDGFVLPEDTIFNFTIDT